MMPKQEIPEDNVMSLDDSMLFGVGLLLTNETATDGQRMFRTTPLRSNVLNITISSLGMILNSLVILVTWRNKHLRNSTFTCLTSLAFADNLFLAMSMIVFTKTDFHKEIPQTVMNFIACFQDCGRLSSAFHLVLLSAIRFYILGFPMKALVHLSWKRTMLFCGVTWVISVVVAGTNVLVLKICWNGHQEKSTLYHYDAIIVYYSVPLTMLIIFHLLKLEWVKKSRRHWGSSDKRSRSMFLMVIFVILMFALLNLPVTLRSILLIHNKRSNLLGEFAAYCLLLNSALNPILYWAFSTQFRTGLHKTFSCVSPKSAHAFRKTVVTKLVMSSVASVAPIRAEENDFDWRVHYAP